ncbi:DNA/RNA non-specific endonuclease [Sphingomonas lenta]|uniref:DNA/RNA non-specific endonuclease n=1 Tax=Sphingomonas lenta TaxID=1141887 RepID=UPI001595062D|nr:DNA/RNA non-specific endonuclease [Sphingomonas lenta]
MLIGAWAVGVSTALLASLSACSIEVAEPPALTCADHYASGTPPTLTNPKLASGTRPLCFGSFAVLHSATTRSPLYVAERLTRTSVEAARALDTRDNRFHPEERLPPAERAELVDYRGSGYDRGHMAPSGDMGDPTHDYESFSLANIVPQDGPLNRNGWADLENYVRDLTSKLGQAYVVTGPAYQGGRLRRLNGRVLVPTRVWKAIYVPGQGAGAWIASNDARADWEVVSIAELASRIGVDPFPTLDAATKAKVPAFPTFKN